MRKLLVALLPVACTVSNADTQHIATGTQRPQQPIVEKGNGCGMNQMAGGGGGYRGRPMAPTRAPKGTMESADFGDMPATAKRARRPAPPPSAPGADKAPVRATGAPRHHRPAEIARPMPMPQPDGVRAGEWDDNANYRDYVKWLGGSSIKGRIDITDRQFLVVTDRAGKAVPNCPIRITNGKHSVKLTTMASGRALLFPAAFGVEGQVTATAMCNGVSATAKLSTKTTDGVAKLTLPTARKLSSKRRVDLAFVLDTTGSMAEEIDAVKQTIKAVSDKLSTSQTDVRIGLVEYKDRSDCLLTRTFPFSRNLPAFSRSIANVQASGGGDMPEDMHKGLDAALSRLQWRRDAATRMIVVIADAPPHFYPRSPDYTAAARRAAERGIKVYTVAASGMDRLGQVVMRQLSQFTGASNMFVLRGGAGPQSVGGGDPASSCGGTHQDYSSGKLDHLILRKLRQELASVDADPMRIPGRGKDENAKPCDQRMVLAN